MGRPCWICGSLKSTREHVWPKWLREIAASDIGVYRSGITTDADGWRVWNGASFTHTARVLCQACNSRLGELEGKVAQVLPTLVGGQTVRITAEAQAAIAQWFYKTG